MAITAEGTQSLCCSHQSSAVLKIWNLTKWTCRFLQVSSFTSVYLKQYSKMSLPPSIRNGKSRGWKKHKLSQPNKKIAMLFFFFLAKSPAKRTVNLQTQWDWSEITSSQMLARVHQQHTTISLLREEGNLGQLSTATVQIYTLNFWIGQEHWKTESTDLANRMADLLCSHSTTLHFIICV